jgi:2-polyprenyl-3-methyl-5-hydroxy-6-metoxy-1,4-benzoquinol methylase
MEVVVRTMEELLTVREQDRPVVASFRDPGGRLIHAHGRVFRLVAESGVGSARMFLESQALDRFRHTGRVIGARVVSAAEARELGLPPSAMCLEHPCLRLRSYPYEWPPEMLAEAGQLTLDLAESLLAEGLGLKDATPYNVLFDGARPVFVDALSVEHRNPWDPIWRPLAQFQRTFLLPLLAQRCGMSLAGSLYSREGLEPADVALLAGPFRRWFPPFLSLATLPGHLVPSAEKDTPQLYRERTASSKEQARFVLQHLFGRLRHQLTKLVQGRQRRSPWVGYQGEHCHYSEPGRDAKREFVAQVLAAQKPGAQVLDVGANEGKFSLQAAAAGCRVTAIDSDPVVAGALWQVASGLREPVLPLVVDLAQPSPAMGWRNSECPSFLQRARGAFDLVLMLAVIHHLLVTHRIPLEEIVQLAAEMTIRDVVVEYVGPEDPQFRRLCRGREALHAGFDEQAMESAWLKRFELMRKGEVPGTERVLYWFRLRP